MYLPTETPLIVYVPFDAVGLPPYPDPLDCADTQIPAIPVPSASVTVPDIERPELRVTLIPLTTALLATCTGSATW